MAGLLDFLSPGPSTGGLLDFLRNKAVHQQMASGLPSDTAQYGAPAMPASYAPPALQNAAPPIPQNPPPVIPASLPAQAQPAPIAPAAPPPSAVPAAAPVVPSTPGIGSGLLTGYENLKHGGGLIGSLIAGVTGQRNDPQGIALQQQAQVANVTARALVAKGVDPQIAIAAVQPGNTEFLKQLIDQKFGPQTLTPLGQGYVADKTGKVTRAYTPEQNDAWQVTQTGQDAMGNKTFEMINKATGERKPLGATTQSAGIGDMNKTGAEYLATVPPQQRGVLQGMIDGTIQPPSSFALSKPYWQTMLAAAKNLDPSFDENTWAGRHKMTTDIASSGNSSMGGILANGKSSFSHLADLSDSMADLGNTSHDFPGGGMLAAAQNYVGNGPMASSTTKAKIKAINDNLGHYGQESTKFYSGTGGGAEERMNALKEMNPAYTSSEEMAAYINKEKDLMLARLREKEDNIRKVMGDQYLQQHPVFTPQFQQTINRIDENVAKLRGQPVSGKSAPQGSPTPGAYVWSPDKGLAPK